MNGPGFHADLRASDATVAWCLRRALVFERLGEGERAALWAQVAARTASGFGHSWLTSAPLESLLVRLGSRVPSPSAVGPSGTRHGARWLHVFSMTVSVGGHTALARRWVARNPFGQQ